MSAEGGLAVQPHAFTDRVTSREELREIVGEPTDLVVRKQLAALDPHCRAFIARSPFLLLGTSSASGTCDVSPRGDAPGFVQILDEGTLVIPERPGNRRNDSLRNILDNPRVGLLFMIPGIEETLRVNGSACIVRDEAMLDRTAHNGKRPLLAIGVAVEEAFLHCAKAFKRSQMWDSASWAAHGEIPSLARMVIDQVPNSGMTVEALERRLEDNYASQLY
jgi:PPOX class probable FMN-dependent enzyme